VSRTLKVAGLVSLLAAGILAAAAFAQDTTTITTTETSTEISTEISTTVTTEPATTEVATTTVQQTTTRKIFVQPTATTAASESGGGTPTWVWVLLAVAGVGLVVLAIIAFTRRGGGHAEVAPAERQRQLDAAVQSWALQGWAIQSRTGDSAVLERRGELLLVSVDSLGHVATRPLTPS